MGRKGETVEKHRETRTHKNEIARSEGGEGGSYRFLGRTLRGQRQLVATASSADSDGQVDK